ncbi:uncharacterized protein LOC141912906 [Tubulanus polymorphus]|uniref:uncharacterized protein LOC141912906 n=1 Tax=Tubulanus polymorphus TaxID=672921 RepID=UPI003DA2ABD0
MVLPAGAGTGGKMLSRLCAVLGIVTLMSRIVYGSSNVTNPTNATVIEKDLKVSHRDVIIINVISYIFVVLVIGGSCGIHFTCKYKEWQKAKRRKPTSDDIVDVMPKLSEVYSVQTDESLHQISTANSTDNVTSSSTLKLFQNTSV